MATLYYTLYRSNTYLTNAYVVLVCNIRWSKWLIMKPPLGAMVFGFNVKFASRIQLMTLTELYLKCMVCVLAHIWKTLAIWRRTNWDKHCDYSFVFFTSLQAIKGIIDNTPPTCSCHGVSGSCTVQSCHSKLPEFEVLGSELKIKYKDACEVAANGRSDNAWISECGREYTNRDLIFRDKYNWCVPDSSIGARGVVGRRCDPNTTGTGSCENLCRKCNRRPQQQEETYSYQCQCSFRFCCSIHCQICTGEREFYTCAWPQSPFSMPPTTYVEVILKLMGSAHVKNITLNLRIASHKLGIVYYAFYSFVHVSMSVHFIFSQNHFMDQTERDLSKIIFCFINIKLYFILHTPWIHDIVIIIHYCWTVLSSL